MSGAVLPGLLSASLAGPLPPMGSTMGSTMGSLRLLGSAAIGQPLEGSEQPALAVSHLPAPSVLGISTHGLFAALGIAAGYWLIVRGLRARDLPSAPAERAIGWGVLAGIVGARAD